MKVALSFLIMPALLLLAFVSHNRIAARRAYKRYQELNGLAEAYCVAWLAASRDYWSRASVQERGYLLDHQRAELDAINKSHGEILEQMSECSRDF